MSADLIELNADTYEVYARGQQVEISGDPYRLLLLMASQPGRTFSKDDVRRHLWPDDSSRSRAHVERLVHVVRGRIERHPSGPIHLLTVPGGYLLQAVVVKTEAGLTPVTQSKKESPPAQPVLRGSAASPRADTTDSDRKHEIWYRAIQRVYRNAIVDHVRRGFIEAFGEDATAQLKKLFGKDWEKMLADAHAARDSHEIDSPIADDFDLLGVNHFHAVLAAQFAILAPEFRSKSAETVGRVRAQAMEYASTVTNVRHPLSHPVSAALSYEDAFRTIDAARRLLEICGRSEAVELQALLDQLRWADVSPAALVLRLAPLDDRLPPQRIAFDFVGRKAELRMLLEWLADGRTKQWALVGEGGKGKTALAYEFALAAKTRAPEPLSVVIWITAKRRRFESGQVFDEAPDFWDLNSELDAFLRQYGWLEYLSASVDEKRKHVLSLLTEFPALVIVDDIDSLAAVDEEAIAFLTLEVSKTPSRILLTLRRRILGLGHVVTQVEGLRGAEAHAFIDSRIRQFNLDPAVFGPKRRARVVEVTEGSPLYMEDLLRLCAAMPVEEAIERWAEKRGDPARQYALNREYELLDNSAKTVLLAASLFDGPVSLPELGAVTNFDDDTLDAAIRVLQDFYLFPKPRLIESIDRFDVNLNVRTLVRRTLANTELYRRVENAAQSVKGTLEHTRDEQGRLDSFQRQAVALARRGMMLEAESTLMTGLGEFPESSDLLGQLGWVYKHWTPNSRLADARDKFKRACALNCRDAEMFRQWLDLEVKEGEWREAARIADIAVERFEGQPEQYSLLQFAGFVYSRWAQLPTMTKKLALEKFETSNRLYWRALKGALEDDAVSRCYMGLAINARLSAKIPTPDEGMPRSHSIMLSVLRQWKRQIAVDARRDEQTRFASMVWPELATELVAEEDGASGGRVRVRRAEI